MIWFSWLKFHVLVTFHILNFNCHKSVFFFKTFYFYFWWAPWLEKKFNLLSNYIYFVWIKIDSEKDIIFILAGAMLKVLWFINEVEQKKLCDYGSPDQLFTFQTLHTVLHFALLRIERKYRFFSNKRPGRLFNLFKFLEGH